MKRLILSMLLCLLFMAGCSKGVQPKEPITDAVTAKVTVIGDGDREYRLDVQKDLDGVARYSFTFPDDVKGLEYSYVGSECTVSFNGLSLSLGNSPNGVVDCLHIVLCNKAALTYDNEAGCFLGATDNFSYRLFTLSDGNLSVIRLDEPKFNYYFNYNP